VSSLTRIEMVVHLQGVDLFAYCSAEQMVRIATIARERHFTPGEGVYELDDPAEAMYCVVEGTVELEGRGGATRNVGAREIFGAREILSDRLREEEARATERAVVLAIDAEDLFDLLSNNIEIVKALFRQLLRQPIDAPAGEIADGAPSENRSEVLEGHVTVPRS